jgi:hypothetical protein
VVRNIPIADRGPKVKSILEILAICFRDSAFYASSCIKNHPGDFIIDVGQLRQSG